MNFKSRLFLNLWFIFIFSGCIAIYKLKSGPTQVNDRNSIVAGNLKLSKEESITVLIRDIMRAPLTLKQDDPILIRKIRKRYLIPPSTKPYNLTGNTDDPSKGQSEQIRKLLKEKRNGFFIECGALDGETISNSLVFEKRYGWDGVLIEGDPKNFRLMLQKNRKVWSVPACLSIFAYPTAVMFEQRFIIGKISNESIGSANHRRGLVEVQCLPLYSILLALNRTTIDYFSLDVEGHEVEVLETIPWDKVNITTLSVEYIHGKGGKEGVKSFMESKGYKVYAEVTFKGSLANDFIFYHPQLLGQSEIKS
ncbi:UNVERIFIED_CONTAM: hypothetical protein RMT77_009630 [Armadillidium vulgare]